MSWRLVKLRECGRQAIETGRNVVRNALTLVFGDDAEGFAAFAIIMRQGVDDLVRYHSVRSWERFRLAAQTIRIEAGKEAVGDRRIGVARTEELLLKFRRSKFIEVSRIRTACRLLAAFAFR